MQCVAAYASGSRATGGCDTPPVIATGRTSMTSYRELIQEIRTTGEEWARKRRELAALQNRRKALHLALRVPGAAEEARAHREDIAGLDEIALTQFEVDLAALAYTSARALFQAAIAEQGGAGGLLGDVDALDRSAA